MQSAMSLFFSFWIRRELQSAQPYTFAPPVPSWMSCVRFPLFAGSGGDTIKFYQFIEQEWIGLNLTSTHSMEQFMHHGLGKRLNVFNLVVCAVKTVLHNIWVSS